MYFVSIDAGAQVAIILLACGPCVVIVNCWDKLCTLGRAPRTKETMPDFRECCRFTRYPHVFCGLTGCQRTPGFWGITFHFLFYDTFPLTRFMIHPQLGRFMINLRLGRFMIHPPSQRVMTFHFLFHDNPHLEDS